jgi:hypothetical protein
MICYLDDDLDQDLLIRLSARRAHQLISPRSVGTSGDPDALHFLYAVSQQIPIMTRNARDFEALHEFGLGIGGHHSGLIIVYDEDDRRKNMRPAEIVAALSNLESASVPTTDQLIALNHYR